MERPNLILSHAGQPQMWMGVNFWSRTGGPLMWRNYDGAEIDAELDQLREHGMTVTRSFFYWPDFHPAPDQIDWGLVDKFRDFLDRHHARGMSSIPTFIVGHMSGQNWDPAWRNGRDLFSDVWFVARQAWYVRELTRALHDHPAISGWLLTNEVPIYGDWRSRGNDSLDPDAVNSWLQILVDAVRAGGGTQPVSAGEGAWGVEITGRDNGFRVRDVANQVDFLGPHVYRMETDQSRQFLGAAYVCEQLHRSGLPVVMEEFGVTSDYTSDINGAHYYRQLLHHTLLAGATGWLAWNNADYDHLFSQAPYTHRPFEQHFGIFDRAHQPKPTAIEMREFAQLLDDLGGTELRRPDSQIAMVVSAYLDNQYPFTQPFDAPTISLNLLQSYVSARHADLPVAFVREADYVHWQPGSPRELHDGVATGAYQYQRQILPQDGSVRLAPEQIAPTDRGPLLPDTAELYLVPATKALTSPTWVRLAELVDAGKTVYASYFLGVHENQRGPWWPNMHDLFGVEKLTRYGLVDVISTDLVEITFQQDFGDLPAGTVLRFPSAGTENARAFLPVVPKTAEVVAVDGAGRPAILRHRRGAGQAILATYPLEHMAAVLPAINPNDVARWYRALAAEVGLLPDVTVADPRVIVGEMHHTDGRRFIWFINTAATEITITPEVRRGQLIQIRGSSAATQLLTPLPQIKLADFAVQVVELALTAAE